MLSVTYAECHIKALYSECRYAECRGALNYAAGSESVKMAKKFFSVACTLKLFTAIIVA